MNTMNTMNNGMNPNGVMPNGSTNPSNVAEEPSAFELRTIFELIRGAWGWFLLSIFLCCVVGFFYKASRTPVYQRSSVLLIKETERNRMEQSLSAMMEVAGMSSTRGIDNELYILSSFQLMGQVVDDLGLVISYRQRQGLRDIVLFDELPFAVEFTNAFSTPVEFNIVDVRKDGVVLNHFTDLKEDETTKKEIFAPYNKVVATPVGNIRVKSLRVINNLKKMENPIVVTRLSKVVATNILRKQVRTSSISKQGTLVNISCQDNNIRRADAILTSIMDLYTKTLVDDKNKQAANTADFIDERLLIITRELGDVENKLTQFKQNNQIADIKSKVETSMAEGSRAKEKSVELEAQLNVSKYVSNFVRDVSKRNELIPNVGGVGNVGLDRQIEEYNELLLRRNRLVENSGEENSVVQEMNRDLLAMRSTIAGSLDTNCKTIALRIADARKQEEASLSVISAIPMQEKQVLDVMRQQAIKEKLYTFLLQSREEIAMQLAGAEANVRVVEKPFGPNKPVGVGLVQILFVCVILGGLIPFVIIFIRQYFDTGVRGRKDINQYTTIPVLGDIPSRPKEQGDDSIVVADNSNNPISESFRLLRTNLDFMYKGAKVLMFTSTIPHEGKTFVSRNFGVTLALTGKKVILVDTDIRKGSQIKLLKRKSREGVSTYLSGNSGSLSDLIVKNAIGGRVDFLPAGMVPPNPAELLMSDRLDEMIKELREEYDYIIVDNVPAMAVADASIVNRVADATLYVMRDGVVDRRYLPELEQLHQEKKFTHLCIVLNDVKEKKTGYGYGYGYGYEDNKKKHHRFIPKKTFLKKILKK